MKKGGFMINKLKLKNFKAFKHLEIEMKPITVLVGPNNSGKSSILQAILLLKQTMNSEDKESPLILGGSRAYFQFGTYKDFVFGNNVRRKLGMGISITNYINVKSKDKLGRKITITQKQINEEINMVFSYRPRRKGIIREKFEVFRNNELFYRNINNKIDFWSKKLGKEERILLKKFISPYNFLDFPFLAAVKYRKKGERLVGSVRMPQIFNMLRKTFSRIVNSLTSVNYIGPLREYPSRTYPYSGEIKNEVGSRGENSIQIIAHSLMRRGKEGRKLKALVSYWLSKMGLAAQIGVKNLTGTLYEARIRNLISKEYENILDVGFANSQVIPIILSGLNIPPNHMFIVEQPEIHLHPKAQAALGDYFVELATKHHKQVLIETHSEYLVLRIQNNVSTGKISPNDVVIYFLDTKKEGKYCTRLDLDKNGFFKQEWPDGFFPERFEETKKLATYLTK